MLYCDTSALVKLYIEETGSDAIKAWVADTDAVAVCRIAWAETHAAFARRVREVSEDRSAIETAKMALLADWPHYIVLESLWWNAPENTPTPSPCVATTACNWRRHSRRGELPEPGLTLPVSIRA